MNLKHRLALLAVPAAAAVMIGGAAVAHAAVTPGSSPTPTQGEVQGTEGPDTNETGQAGGAAEVETADAPGTPGTQSGHDDGPGQNVDHQFDGNE